MSDRPPPDISLAVRDDSDGEHTDPDEDVIEAIAAMWPLLIATSGLSSSSGESILIALSRTSASSSSFAS
jgi:hypothetical protein